MRLSNGAAQRLTPSGDSQERIGPESISADGGRVLVISDADDLPFPGPYRLEVHEVASGSVTIVADPAGGTVTGANPAGLSPDGEHVVFVSQVDLTGGNADNNAELFRFDVDTATLSQVTDSVTPPGGDPQQDNTQPRFVDDSTISFVSRVGLTEPNPSGEPRAHLFNVDSGVISILDDALPGAIPVGATDVWLSAGSSTVAYESSGDPTGHNPDGNQEVFSYDVASGSTTQLTDSPRTGSELEALSADGSTVLFSSWSDYLGAPLDRSNELFVVPTCAPAPNPDASIATSPAGPFAGDDVVSSVGVPAQRQQAPIASGGSATFQVRVQNDRSVVDRLSVAGVDRGSPGYRVVYRLGRQDITTAVRTGDWRTGPLDPGEFVTIKVKVTATTAAAGSGRTVDVTATSRTNPVARDTVRAKVSRL